MEGHAENLRALLSYAPLTGDEAALLGSIVRRVELSAGQVLFREGSVASAMWVLLEPVEVSVSSARVGRRPVAVTYARAGDTLGEMALVDEAPRSASALVTVGGTAVELSADGFRRLRQAQHPAAYKVLRRICGDLCRKLRATNDRIVPASPTSLSAPPLHGMHRPSPELLDQFAPFAALPAVVKLALAQKLWVVDVGQVTPIIGEGEPADATYFILSGEVTVGRNGRTLATLGPGAVFGLVSAIDEGRRSASCVTSGPARLLRLDDPDFDALFAAANRFAFHLVDLVARQLVTRIRQANALLPGPGELSRPLASDGPDEELLPEAEILPLDLEVEVSDERAPVAGS